EAVVVEGDVLGDRELEYEAAPLAILGDVADAGVEQLARAAVGVDLAADGDLPGGCAEEAGERVDQLRLPVAVDAGDADDLAGANLERDAPHLLEAALVEDVEVFDLEQWLGRLRGGLVDAQEHLAADHHPGEALLGRAGARHGVDPSAAPQDGDPVGHL